VNEPGFNNHNPCDFNSLGWAQRFSARQTPAMSLIRGVFPARRYVTKHVNVPERGRATSMLISLPSGAA